MIEPRARLDAPFQSFEASIKIPRGMDGATAALVVAFAEALAEKLHKADNKYGYGDLWAREDWRRRCQGQLIKHLKKGDSRDVAAYCAFLWYHGWPTVFPKKIALQSRGNGNEHSTNRRDGRSVMPNNKVRAAEMTGPTLPLRGDGTVDRDRLVYQLKDDIRTHGGIAQIHKILVDAIDLVTAHVQEQDAQIAENLGHKNYNGHDIAKAIRKTRV